MDFGDRPKASSIRFEGASKWYPRATHAAVEEVTLSIAPGELVVLLGPSGCGKTTLLKLVNRLLEPTSGRVLIDGRDVRDLPAHDLRRGIGYVIQQAGLFPHMRVDENIAVVPRLLGWETARISRRVNELLDLVGLAPERYRRRYPHHLSGGEQQRVGLARALAAGPSMLLMDEPFGALDAITRARLQDELRAIHASLGQTVLFVTHDVEEAMLLADRVAVMNHGRIVQYDKPSCVVLSPASEFVADLLGSNDVLRRLSLMPVSVAIKPLREHTPGGLPSIAGTRNLRHALGVLLGADEPLAIVMDEAGKPVGTIDLEAIHEAAMAAPRLAPAGGDGP